MALSTIGTNQIASEAVTVPKVTDQVLSSRNFIINGDMQCWQRATAATAANNSYSTVDRWAFGEGTDGAYTSERSTDTPTGTGFSIKAQVTTADTSLAAGQYAYIWQSIEAQNLQSLLYGTASAKTLTLSFWVKSSKTGTYSIVIRKNDSTLYAFTHDYSISSANTWEKKTITITPTAGSTSFITASAGAIANDNGLGFEVIFALGQGSTYAIGTSNTWSSNSNTYASSNQVNWMDSTSNNFYLSQVQLEVGDVATPFEHENFDVTLDKCKRYYQNSFAYGTTPANDISGVRMSEMPPSDSVSYAGAIVYLDKPMRATPTCQAYNPQAAATNSGAYVNDLVNGSVTTEYAVSSVYAKASKLRFFLSTAPTTGGNPYGCNWTADSEL